MNDWYRESREAVAKVYGDDAELFVALLAATSPHTALHTNVTLATKAYHQLKRGDIVVGFLPTHKANIERARDGQELTGQKVRAFHANLCGDESAVTIDLWMQRHYGYDGKALTSKRYKELSTRIATEAKKQGKTPAQWQSEIWVGIRGSGESYGRYLEGRQLAMELK